MATLFIYHYNNYYNRKLKKEEELQDYGNPIIVETGTFSNFNPNDGVTTKIILGRQNNPYDGSGDYLIYSENNVDITSRWFIIEQQRTMGGQYRISLKRDVLADYWGKVLTADSFIEKATLNELNPLIFNQEEITTNQIKTSETLLKDKTGVPWIVFYYDKKGTISGSIALEENYDFAVGNIETWVAENNNRRYIPQGAADTDFRVYWENVGFDDTIFYAALNRQGETGLGLGSDSTLVNRTIPFSLNNLFYMTPATQREMYNRFFLDNPEYLKNYEADQFFNTYNGAILYQNVPGQEKYFRVTVTRDETYREENIFAAENSNLYTYLNAGYANIRDHSTITGTANGESFSCKVKYYTLSLTVSEIFSEDIVSYEVNSNCYDLNDAPYRMACMPFGAIKEKYNGSETTSNKDLNFRIVNSLITAEGSEVYDAQILPYCPLNEQFIEIDSDNQFISINAGNDQKLAHPIKDGNNNVLGYIYSCSQSSFSRHIEYTKTIENYKIENQCDLWRLCSPNYQGVFEFSAAKNNGIFGFDLTCTYKPFIPYIHLNPDFQGLYGTDFGDNRGLVCGGDFSLAKVTNNFTEFMLNQKNFQASFDRQIQNMEVNHKYDMIHSGVSAAVGALSTGAAGSLINPVLGVAGGIASAIGGAADLAIKEELYKETLDYKKDMFGYQLENIKAQPQSLSRTTAFSYDNKYFPFLEFYTCTDEEKLAVAKKIAWNGMSVGIIDKIENLVNNTWSYGEIHDKGYIKAQLIRIEGIDDDAHLVNAISEELLKGVYTK